ncbi:MAG: transcription repressor NadR [Chloroflexi bacterium]|nr:transcription repressor NadR [Chloroflexota bacterium]
MSSEYGEPSGCDRTGDERRQEIMTLLHASERPITGGELATRMGVSRQAVVQDIALLRARGEGVVATPFGYLLAERLAPVALRAILACRHSREATEDELLTMVDLGLRVIDVVVEHPLYGELRGLLRLESREDVRHFMDRLRVSEASLLSALTKGVHLHTVEASRPEVFALARAALHDKGYLLEDSEED